MLTPALLLTAYSQGIFPMADAHGRLHWYDPNPRAVLPLADFHTPRRLQRVVEQRKFDIRFDSAFPDVIAACAKPAPGREDTWINPDILAAYTQLHALGYAHSVEAWQAGCLVGGLYGVALHGLFAGESMFSQVTDASKVALVHLVTHIRARGFALLDVQYVTSHLGQFGAVELSRAEYRRRLQAALDLAVTF